MVSTASRPDVRIVVWGNARPSSSAVRRAPITAYRSARPPHSGQAQSAARCPHQRQPAISTPPPGNASGPAHTVQRAEFRHRPQESDGAYPRRGTWTSTGAPAASEALAACQPTVGSRAVAAAASRAS